MKDVFGKMPSKKVLDRRQMKRHRKGSCVQKESENGQRDVGGNQ
jgi:hypothetical protein